MLFSSAPCADETKRLTCCQNTRRARAKTHRGLPRSDDATTILATACVALSCARTGAYVRNTRPRYCKRSKHERRTISVRRKRNVSQRVKSVGREFLPFVLSVDAGARRDHDNIHNVVSRAFPPGRKRRFAGPIPTAETRRARVIRNVFLRLPRARVHREHCGYTLLLLCVRVIATVTSRKYFPVESEDLIMYNAAL